MAHHVELNIYQAVNRLEGLKGRRYSDSEIAKRLGVHRHTVSAIRKGRNEPSLARLLDFFTAEGMPIILSDLFVVASD